MINPIIEENLNLADDRLCLDFSNTAEWHASNSPVEHLNTYQDLLNWSLEKGLMTEQEAEAVGKQATLHSEKAQAVLERAIDLREAMYAIFSASVHKEAARAADLELLNRWLEVGMAHLKLNTVEEGYNWNWSNDQNQLDAMLWWTALSAGQLLASENLAKVGQCADDRGCGWLFYDTSRNHSRRWCDMKDCGNRAKSHRHYEKIQDLRPEKAA